MITLRYTVDEASLLQVKKYICKVSNDFNPPFIEEVKDLDMYLDKICSKAKRFEVWLDNILIGLMFAYLNEELSQIYIPFISVDRDYRKRGIARALLDQLKFFKGYSFIRLEVIKNNEALFFYRKYGFVIEENRNNKYLMKYSI
ncbi:GNAT family N-acetyltransferase [Prevotella bivia]|uniref:Acetyltransferase n=1 Tax=Prevotella bivia DSM 20514 TaxID=868129 RepID=I4Z9C4_9BACT|nr:GNAT family N-acetyltransferase [Prevotella bivia]EFB92588.1 acetyltransferase, GNAT family [Prevotella bivia JCVIHMP010]EIM32816.1 acetyltransferase [Prevotella bivia DSM 20514]